MIWDIGLSLVEITPRRKDCLAEKEGQILFSFSILSAETKEHTLGSAAG
jgi:hypothetical protein